MENILIIGCASIDTIHLEKNGERQTCNTEGGAGLYTALAAGVRGANVTLFAPRPEPMPERFEFLDRRVRWIGPAVSIEQMPELEIIHHGAGRATLLKASWGAEALLSPALLLDVCHESGVSDQQYDIVHIAALSSAGRQLEFFDFLKRSGSIYKRISAGTYASAIAADKPAVECLVKQADLFFMNENEARLLFQSRPFEVGERQVVFVTGGNNGVRIFEGKRVIAVDAAFAEELDPTGAGDTFCGATLAGIAKDERPEVSAADAVKIAARVIEQPGASYWLDEGCRNDL